MVKNIENFRLISDNVNSATEKMQNAVQKIEESGIIDETKDLIKSAKGTMGLVNNAGQDFREISLSIKEIFRSIRGAQDTIHDVAEKYHRTEPANEIVVVPYEVEEYLRLGWQYIGTLPNGKIVIRKEVCSAGPNVEWVTDLL